MDSGFFPQSPSVPLVLTIDLGAVVHNYRQICLALKKGTTCAAVLKANAYGLGVKEIAPLLYQEGCRHFFVAHLSEAIELKGYVGEDASIYVLNGLRKGDEEVYFLYSLIPVLSDLDQVRVWNGFSQKKNQCLKAALHFDTGMTRTGISQRDIKNFGVSNLSHIEIVLVMSHLACAYEPSHPMNEAQRLAFDGLQQHFPFSLASLANSGGCFLEPKYHYDMVRVGLALAGCSSLNPLSGISLKPAVKGYAQLLQIQEIARGESIGYDVTFIASKASRIATLGVGYADGYLRSLSNQGEVSFNRQRLPIVGRVSMDLMTVDISEVPSEEIRVGDWVELFGETISLHELAQKAGTISWEVMTRLGARFERFYLNMRMVEKAA